jgi:hypothetical protein
MSVPNEYEVVRRLFLSGVFDLKTHEGQGAFTDAVVSALHAKDERWGHLKKNASQTNEHGHGEDAALYLSEVDGESTAVDFIGGAGGNNPQPAWQVDSPRYSKKDWADPTEHGFGQPSPVCPPVPPTFPYPDENTAGKAFQARVKQAYTDAHRPFPDPNDQDAFRHFMRYGYSARSMPEPEAANKHIAELRAQLGV